MAQMFAGMDHMNKQPLHVDDNHHSMRGKCAIPSYSGSYDGEKYFDWEIAIEQELNSHFVPEQHRVRQATSKFKDFAIIWWYELAAMNALPSTWEQLKEAMRDRFIPFSYKRDLLRKIQCLLQGNRSVQEYYKEFQKCSICCEINECEEATENRFLHGLRPEIQNILVDHSYCSLPQLFELACMAENNFF